MRTPLPAFTAVFVFIASLSQMSSDERKRNSNRSTAWIETGTATCFDMASDFHVARLLSLELPVSNMGVVSRLDP